MDKLRDTKLGSWLKEKAPKIFETVADALPDAGLLGVVKNLVNADSNLSHEQKLEFERLEQQERIALEENITLNEVIVRAIKLKLKELQNDGSL